MQMSCLKWCFAAERGAVNDVSKNLNFRGIPFTIGPLVEQPTDCARAYGYRDKWVFLDYLPLTDALNGWWQVITSR